MVVLDSKQEEERTRLALRLKQAGLDDSEDDDEPAPPVSSGAVIEQFPPRPPSAESSVHSVVWESRLPSRPSTAAR